eukprot:m.978407 g.978407  ORF g.978407 m.978407 type:complete len:359 (-) comp23957_c0_seq1:2254-3330(-)
MPAYSVNNAKTGNALVVLFARNAEHRSWHVTYISIPLFINLTKPTHSRACLPLFVYRRNTAETIRKCNPCCAVASLHRGDCRCRRYNPSVSSNLNLFRLVAPSPEPNAASVLRCSVATLSSSCAHSITSRRPYKCVLRLSASNALNASFFVKKSTNANPLWAPSNFLGSRMLLIWPNAWHSSFTSFLLASKGRFRTNSLVPPAFTVRPRSVRFRDADSALLEIFNSSLCPSSSPCCNCFMASFASSMLLNSTKPNPMDSTCPLCLGSFFVAMRALRMATHRSKNARKSSSVVAKFKFLTKTVVVGADELSSSLDSSSGSTAAAPSSFVATDGDSSSVRSRRQPSGAHSRYSGTCLNFR